MALSDYVRGVNLVVLVSSILIIRSCRWTAPESEAPTQKSVHALITDKPSNTELRQLRNSCFTLQTLVLTSKGTGGY